MTPTPRRTVLTAAALAAVAAAASGSPAAAVPAGRRVADTAAGTVEYHAWTSAADWRAGTARGTALVSGDRSGILLRRSQGTIDYTDPHTGTTSAWEHAQ